MELLNPPRVNHMPSSGKKENAFFDKLCYFRKKDTQNIILSCKIDNIISVSLVDEDLNYSVFLGQIKIVPKCWLLREKKGGERCRES